MTTLTQQSQAFALDFHALLRDFDPTHFKSNQEAALKERLEDLERKLQELVDAHDKSNNMEAVEPYLHSLKEALHTHLPHERVQAMSASWTQFRQQAIPIYEQLAEALKDYNAAVPSFRHTRPTNYKRNLFHVGIALFCVALVQFVPPMTSLGFWLITIIAGSFALTGWALEISRRQSKWVNDMCMKLFAHVAHPHELHHINSSTWYTTALFLISLSQSPLLCTVSLGILGVSDPAAAIIGKRYGRTRFANGRSLEGTLTFILTGTLAAVGLLAIFHPQLNVVHGLWIALAGAIVGGLVELWIEFIDDNLAIPITSILASALMAWLLGVPF